MQIGFFLSTSMVLKCRNVWQSGVFHPFTSPSEADFTLTTAKRKYRNHTCLWYTRSNFALFFPIWRFSSSLFFWFNLTLHMQQTWKLNLSKRRALHPYIRSAAAVCRVTASGTLPCPSVCMRVCFCFALGDVIIRVGGSWPQPWFLL